MSCSGRQAELVHVVETARCYALATRCWVGQLKLANLVPLFTRSSLSVSGGQAVQLVCTL